MRQSKDSTKALRLSHRKICATLAAGHADRDCDCLVGASGLCYNFETITRKGRRMTLYIKESCPACRHLSGVPLFFGMPGPLAFDAERRGELVIGGCEQMSDANGNILNLACLHCAYHWHDPDFDDTEEEVEDGSQM